jgi:hypothetical protein
MDRRLLLLVVAVVALVGVVNATVYAYRWITGTVTYLDQARLQGQRAQDSTALRLKAA